MFKAVITTVVMALSEKQKNCSSDKTTTVCGDSSESLQLPTKPHSRGCESTYNKVLFTPPTMCRLTTYCNHIKSYCSKIIHFVLCSVIISTAADNSLFSIINCFFRCTISFSGSVFHFSKYCIFTISDYNINLTSGRSEIPFQNMPATQCYIFTCLRLIILTFISFINQS